MILSATLFSAACDENATGPSPVGRVTFGQPAPASGGTIPTTGTPPGAFIPRGSGWLSIPMTVRSGREVPSARLYVYLLTAEGYCGQNLPDAPAWGPLERGQTVSVTITGFQVFRLPCQVTGVRAMLHTRNSGLLIPPTPDETVAEGVLGVTYTIQ